MQENETDENPVDPQQVSEMLDVMIVRHLEMLATGIEAIGIADRVDDVARYDGPGARLLGDLKLSYADLQRLIAYRRGQAGA